MRYFLSAADRDLVADWTERLEANGYAVAEAYDEAADLVVLSLGGDGSILYNARRFGEPTILPVAGPGSEANTIEIDGEDLLGRLAVLEDGVEGVDYRIERHRKLATTSGGADGDGNSDPIRADRTFTGLNDVHLHHTSPVRTAKFAVRVLDSDGDATGDRRAGADGRERLVYEADRVIGDGVLVATPFGSSGYYRSITGGTVETGIGVALNNVHKPADAPRSISLSARGRVELELLTTTRSSSAVLARDDDPDVRELSPGDPISISLSDQVVKIVRFDR